ncbi:uncharacterized protein LOC144487902 [Mustelus asterias]
MQVNDGSRRQEASLKTFMEMEKMTEELHILTKEQHVKTEIRAESEDFTRDEHNDATESPIEESKQEKEEEKEEQLMEEKKRKKEDKKKKDATQKVRLKVCFLHRCVPKYNFLIKSPASINKCCWFACLSLQYMMWRCWRWTGVSTVRSLRSRRRSCAPKAYDICYQINLLDFNLVL